MVRQGSLDGYDHAADIVEACEGQEIYFLQHLTLSINNPRYSDPEQTPADYVGPGNLTLPVYMILDIILSVVRC